MTRPSFSSHPKPLSNLKEFTHRPTPSFAIAAMFRAVSRELGAAWITTLFQVIRYY